MRQILFTSKETQKRPPFQCHMLPYRPLQHWILRLKRIKDCPLRHPPLHIQRHLTPHARHRAQVLRQLHPDHASVCASTDRTAGKSLTIGAQLSPPSDDPYTCPPVVPKYT